MHRGGEGGPQGPRLDRLTGLVLAMIVGALVPVGAVAWIGSRQPAPRDCAAGPATPTRVEGALLYTTGSDLWYSEGYPGHPRKLIDFNPPPPRPTRPSPRPSPSARPSPSPSASSSLGASPTASPSPSPPPPATRVVAADISADRKRVAALVLDLPHRAGTISLQLLSPLDPAGPGSVEGWSGNALPGSTRTSQVTVLDNGRVLLLTPVKALSGPFPVPPSPAPSPSGREVVVVAPSPSPRMEAYGAESFLLAGAQATWTMIKGYPVPKAEPGLLDRVSGPHGRVAGVRVAGYSTPLLSRQLNEITLGRDGESNTTLLCAAATGTRPQLFSPDGSKLVLTDSTDTRLIDLSGTHAATSMMAGVLLAWRS